MDILKVDIDDRSIPYQLRLAAALAMAYKRIGKWEIVIKKYLRGMKVGTVSRISNDQGEYMPKGKKNKTILCVGKNPRKLGDYPVDVLKYMIENREIYE